MERGDKETGGVGRDRNWEGRRERGKETQELGTEETGTGRKGEWVIIKDRQMRHDL